ncbi:MAG: metallopeptidase family protein [Armatimonadetes bacterium]|nr:metallopeptidase family protein [Armatimonadota bacterium]
MRLSRRRFERLVAEALEGIPEEIRRRMDNVEVVVEDWPTREQLASVDLGDEDLLFGLYEGVPLIERGITASPILPDKITIFQGPLLEACETEAEITEEVRRTVVHEVAHHFGLGEDEIARLGY